jgi:hypothetical protein
MLRVLIVRGEPVFEAGPGVEIDGHPFAQIAVGARHRRAAL